MGGELTCIFVSLGMVFASKLEQSCCGTHLLEDGICKPTRGQTLLQQKQSGQLVQQASQAEMKTANKVKLFIAVTLSSIGRLAAEKFALLKTIYRREDISREQAILLLLVTVSLLFCALYAALRVEFDKRYGDRRPPAVANRYCLRWSWPRRVSNLTASWEGRTYFPGPPLTQWPDSCEGVSLQLNYESLLCDGEWVTKAVSSNGRELLIRTEDLGRGDRALHVEVSQMEHPFQSTVIAYMKSDLHIYSAGFTSWDRPSPRFKLRELGNGIFELMEFGVPSSPGSFLTSIGPEGHSNSKRRARIRCRRAANSGATGLLFDMTSFDDLHVLASARIDTYGCLVLWTCMGVDVVPILLIFVGLITFRHKYGVDALQ